MNMPLEQLKMTYTDFEQRLENAGLQLLIKLKVRKRISITCDEDNQWLYYCLCYLEITINNNKVIQSGRKDSIVGLGPWKVAENADAIVVFSLNKGKYNDINIVELENEYKKNFNCTKAYHVYLTYETSELNFYTEFGCYFWNELTSIKKAKQLGINVRL